MLIDWIFQVRYPDAQRQTAYEAAKLRPGSWKGVIQRTLRINWRFCRSSNRHGWGRGLSKGKNVASGGP